MEDSPDKNPASKDFLFFFAMVVLLIVTSCLVISII